MAIMGFHPSPHRWYRCALMPSFFLAAAGSPPFTNSIAWPMFQQRCPLCASEANKESQDWARIAQKETQLSVSLGSWTWPCHVSFLVCCLWFWRNNAFIILHIYLWSFDLRNRFIRVTRLTRLNMLVHTGCEHGLNRCTLTAQMGPMYVVMGCHGMSWVNTCWIWKPKEFHNGPHTHTNKVPLIRLSHSNHEWEMMICHDLSANHQMPLIASMLGSERSCLCEWCFQVGQDKGFLALLERNGQVFNGFTSSHVRPIDGFTIQDQMGDWWVRFACSSHGAHAKLLQTSGVCKAQSSIHSNHDALGHHPTLWIVPHISKGSILHLATDCQVGHGHFVGQLQNGQWHPCDEAFLHCQAQRHQKGGHLISGWLP